MSEKREEYREVRETVVEPKKPGLKAHLRRAHKRRFKVNVKSTENQKRPLLTLATQQLADPQSTIKIEKYSRELRPVIDYLTQISKQDNTGMMLPNLFNPRYGFPQRQGNKRSFQFNGGQKKEASRVFLDDNLKIVTKATLQIQSQNQGVSVSKKWGTVENWASQNRQVKPEELDSGLELLEDDYTAPNTAIYHESQLVGEKVEPSPHKNIRTAKTEAMLNALSQVGVETEIGFMNGYITESETYLDERDKIMLVNEEHFFDSLSFVRTYAHELAHATGASHRLNRSSLVADAGQSDEEYLKDELVAELTASIVTQRLIELTSHLGGEPQVYPESLIKYNAEYLYLHLEKPQEELRHLQWAVNEAEKAADWILERATTI